MKLASWTEGIWPSIPIEYGHLPKAMMATRFGPKGRCNFLILTDSSVSVKFLFFPRVVSSLQMQGENVYLKIITDVFKFEKQKGG